MYCMRTVKICVPYVKPTIRYLIITNNVGTFSSYVNKYKYNIYCIHLYVNLSNMGNMSERSINIDYDITLLLLSTITSVVMT